VGARGQDLRQRRPVLEQLVDLAGELADPRRAEELTVHEARVGLDRREALAELCVLGPCSAEQVVLRERRVPGERDGALDRLRRERGQQRAEQLRLGVLVSPRDLGTPRLVPAGELVAMAERVGELVALRDRAGDEVGAGCRRVSSSLWRSAWVSSSRCAIAPATKSAPVYQTLT
jgi:hypothetical protein